MAKINRDRGKRMRWPGIEPGSNAWKASMLTITPPTLDSESLESRINTHSTKISVTSLYKPHILILNKFIILNSCPIHYNRKKPSCKKRCRSANKRKSLNFCFFYTVFLHRINSVKSFFEIFLRFP